MDTSVAIAVADDGMIFHILTEIPEIHDYTMFGPFYCREAMIPSIIDKLQRTTTTGVQEFDEVMSGLSDLASFEQFSTKTNDGYTLNMEVVQEENPKVAATLPGEAWVVICAKVNTTTQYQEGLSIGGTYASCAAANRGAEELIADIVPGGEHICQSKPDGTVVWLGLGKQGTFMVESRHDKGEK